VTEQALVLLSGGQDSTTCLYWAVERFGRDRVRTLSFDYGQRHRRELDCAAEIAAQAGVANDVLEVDTLKQLGGNALTDPDLPVAPAPDRSLPNTFVPGRNLVFLTYAAAYAWPRGIRHLVAGVAQTDYSGYPDCREQTVVALTKALNLGMEADFQLHTPLMHRSKKDTVLLARELGALDAMALTHTCYEGSRPPCGRCPACELRAKGFAEAGVPDPLLAS